MRSTRTLARRDLADKSPCAGPGSFWAKIFDENRGHKFIFFNNARTHVVGCSVCGCYAYLQAVGLLGQCPGHMTTARAKYWNKLCTGRHPYTGELLGEPQSMETALRAAAAQQAAFLDDDDEN